MDLPPDLLINGTLEQGCVYYYSDDSFIGDVPHFFVVLNKNPHADSFLVLTNATSKVEKTKEIIIARNLPPATFVSVPVGECSFLTKETAFDCNTIHKRTKEELMSLVKKGTFLSKGTIPSSILQRILTGVMRSPLVEEKVKKKIL